MVREQYCPVLDMPSSGEAAWTAFWLLVALGLVTTALHSLGSGCGSGHSHRTESCWSGKRPGTPRGQEKYCFPKLLSDPHLQSQSHFFSYLSQLHISDKTDATVAHEEQEWQCGRCRALIECLWCTGIGYASLVCKGALNPGYPVPRTLCPSSTDSCVTCSPSICVRPRPAAAWATVLQLG